MALYYGDLLCVKTNNIVHIVKNGTSCLCGQKYKYGASERNNDSSPHIIWRNLDAVTCDKCKEILKSEKEK